MSDAKIKAAFGLCRELGFVTESFNMVGIPGDTPKTILDTVKLNAAIGVDLMQVSIYQPYPGTRLAATSGFSNRRPIVPQSATSARTTIATTRSVYWAPRNVRDYANRLWLFAVPALLPPAVVWVAITKVPAAGCAP